MAPKGCINCGNPAIHRQKYCTGCRYITQSEAYRLLGISRASWYRLVQSGRVHPRNITAGKIIVARAEVDAILGGTL